MMLLMKRIFAAETIQGNKSNKQKKWILVISQETHTNLMQKMSCDQKCSSLLYFACDVQQVRDHCTNFAFFVQCAFM